MNRTLLLNSTVGEYRLVNYLGAGGMGEVYRGVHAKIGRVVAVKVLTQTALSPGAVERFLNEARIHSTLHHPNIVTLYDFLELDGRPCIIMEYVDGQTLTDRIRSYGALPMHEAIPIFKSIVEAISYIHSRGIIHRDIKSNNVRISSTGQVKLLDFGIAKDGATPMLTLTGDVVGTLYYLSPEQIKGGAADARSDIWALGVLLYEMLTGRVPFESTTIGDLCEKIGAASYMPVSALNPAVPRDIEAIIARCLKKRAAERYQSAQEVLDDLTRAVTRVDGLRPASVGRASADAIKPQAPSSLPLAWVLGPTAAVIALAGAISLSVVMMSDWDGGPPAPAGANQAAANQSASNTRSGELRTITLEVSEGRAEVYRDGQLLGTTPFEMKARPGEPIKLVLRREGYYDKAVDISMTDNRKVYTYSLVKKN